MRHDAYYDRTTATIDVGIDGIAAGDGVCVYFGHLPFSHPLFDQFGIPTVRLFCACAEVVFFLFFSPFQKREREMRMAAMEAHIIHIIAIRK